MFITVSGGFDLFPSSSTLNEHARHFTPKTVFPKIHSRILQKDIFRILISPRVIFLVISSKICKFKTTGLLICRRLRGTRVAQRKHYVYTRLAKYGGTFCSAMLKENSDL
jgi:hypothetical protein